MIESLPSLALIQIALVLVAGQVAEAGSVA